MHLIKQTLGLRFLSKKFIHDGKIELVSVSLKMAKMVPLQGKVGMLHLSCLLNEFGDPTFFLILLCAYHEIQPCEVSGNFQFLNNC